jgi:hypothetical protein
MVLLFWFVLWVKAVFHLLLHALMDGAKAG